MNLATQYLGLSLKNPLLLGSSPITTDLDKVLRVVEAGASALVMHTLFDEQLQHARTMDEPLDPELESMSIPPSMRPSQPRGQAMSEEYLEQLVRIKRRVGVPVIASLNASTEDGWLYHARNLEDAGADAIELNVEQLSLDPEVSASLIEERLVQMVRQVSQSVRVPVSVKLAPYYAGLPNLARRLVVSGARGLTLFNRLYEPDIDLESGSIEPQLALSSSSELGSRLRWLAALSPKLSASLAASGGVHTASDAIKAIAAGAEVVQLVSAVLQRGPQVFSELESQLNEWLVSHAYDGLAHARGSMSVTRCPDPMFYRRNNYLKLLTGWERRTR